MPVPQPAFGITDPEIHPLSGRIGALIDGVRLSGDLPDRTIAAIDAALSKHRVIFFRNQEHLDDAGQECFALRFGELFTHPTTPVRAGGALGFWSSDSTDGRGRADRWHTDLTFLDAYPRLSVLSRHHGSLLRRRHGMGQ